MNAPSISPVEAESQYDAALMMRRHSSDIIQLETLFRIWREARVTPRRHEVLSVSEIEFRVSSHILLCYEWDEQHTYAS
jgi:hypothetical protein